MSVPRVLRRLPDIVRWRLWGDSKLPPFILAICWGARDAPSLPSMAALLLLLALYAAFGHVVNDLADRDPDRAAGKRSAAGGLTRAEAGALLLATSAGPMAIAWAGFGSASLAWTAAALLLATAYSVRPVRLKERGLLGWLAAALAQRTLPVVIALLPSGRWDPAAVGLLAFSTLVGLRFIIVHQMQDRAADLRAGTRTLATEQSPEHVMLALRLVFGLELLTLGGTVLLMAVAVPAVGAAGLGYAAWIALSPGRRRSLSPLRTFVLYGFTCVVWPLSLALGLAWRQPGFLAVAVVLAALVLRRAWPAKAAAGGGVPAGVRALAAMQGSDGSFPLWTGTAQWAPCGPLFSTAYVLMAAGRLLPAETVARAVAYLRAVRRDDGLWEYDPALRMPPDADSTACALAALAQFGAPGDVAGGPALLRRFWRTPAGPFRTWFAEGAWSAPERDDAVVNCHVLHALLLMGDAVQGAELRAVREIVRGTSRSRYYHAPASVALAAHRAGVPAGWLHPATVARPPTGDFLALAEWLSLLAQPDRTALDVVRSAQAADGAWPTRPWVTGEGVPRPFWGSPAISTALALEALARSRV